MKRFFILAGIVCVTGLFCSKSPTTPDTVPAVTPEAKANIVIENLGGVELSIVLASVTGRAHNIGNADAALVHVYVTIEGDKSDGTKQSFESWAFADHPDLAVQASSNFTVYFDDSSHAIHHLTNLIVKSTHASWSKPGAKK